MTITLTIDNLDSLPDGGPTRFQARNRSFEIGRESHLDWTLPDPGRYISGRHCEVRFENGGYWLYDTSTNGVFVNGSSSRVKSPYRLEDGDRLSIGHYIVNVSVERDARPVSQHDRAADAAPAAPAGDDIWTIDAPAPQPVARREFMPPASSSREADFSNQFLEFPGFVPTEPTPRDAPVWGVSEAAPVLSSPARPEPTPSLNTAPDPPPVPSSNQNAPVMPAGLRPMPVPAERQAPAVNVRPAFPPREFPAPAPAAALHGSDFVRAFAAGAEVSPDILRGRSPDELAFEAGVFVRIAVESLKQLLKARAAAKTMAKSTNRTMISATDNNPLKFVPATPETIEVMFARNRAGYLDAKHSLEEAFSDLKRHELATFGAMQKALARLVEDFAPETIEEKLGPSAFPLKKSRAWDLFVSKWRESEAGENGMLDKFLSYFSEYYDENSDPDTRK